MSRRTIQVPLNNWFGVPVDLIDDGHIKEMTEAEVKVFIYLLRETVGRYCQLKTRIPVRQIASGIGMSLSSTSTACVSLEEMGCIARDKNPKGSEAGYGGTEYEITLGTIEISPDEILLAEHREEILPPEIAVLEGETQAEQPNSMFGPPNKAFGQPKNLFGQPNSIIRNIERTENIEEIEEGVYTPNPSTFVDCADVIRIWNSTRGLKKLTARERQVFREKWTYQLTEEQVRSGLLDFATWVRSKGDIRVPMAVYIANPEQWDGSQSRRNEPGRIEEPRVDTTHTQTSSDALYVAPWASDDLFGKYIQVFIAAGVAIGDKERDDAWPHWSPLTKEQKKASGRDAVRYCSERETRFIKAPRGHLLEKPWTRVVQERVMENVNDNDPLTRSLRFAKKMEEKENAERHTANPDL